MNDRILKKIILEELNKVLKEQEEDSEINNNDSLCRTFKENKKLQYYFGEGTKILVNFNPFFRLLQKALKTAKSGDNSLVQQINNWEVYQYLTIVAIYGQCTQSGVPSQARLNYDEKIETLAREAQAAIKNFYGDFMKPGGESVRTLFTNLDILNGIVGREDMSSKLTHSNRMKPIQ